MPKITVVYHQTRRMVQTIDWPEDEMGLFNEANLDCNLDPEESQQEWEDNEVMELTKDGEEFGF